MVATAARHRARRRPRRQFRRPATLPRVYMTGSVDMGTPDAPDPVPLIVVEGAEALDQMALDRLIASTGLKSWVRPVHPGDMPDLAAAVDPTPEDLATAEGMASAMGQATHVLVTAISEHIRTRVPLTVLDGSVLN